MNPSKKNDIEGASVDRGSEIWDSLRMEDSFSVHSRKGGSEFKFGEHLSDGENKIQLALWASGDGIWEWNSESKKFIVHHLIFLGEESDSSQDSVDLFDFIHRDDLADFNLHLSALVEEREDYINHEFRVIYKENEFWLRVCGRSVRRSDRGVSQYMTGTVKNITDQKKDKELLHLLGRMFSVSTDGLVITDGAFCILKSNKAYKEIIHGISSNKTKCLLAGVLDLGIGPASAMKSGFWSGICRLTNDKRKRFFEVRVNRVNDNWSREQRFLISLRDVSHREKSKEELERMATQDPLTHLPNRIAIESHLQIRVMAEKSSFGLLFVDIDGFKVVNASHGHGVGDLLLNSVAKRIKQSVGSSFVGRWSGNAFVVIVPMESGESIIHEQAQSIRRTLNMPYSILSHEVSVTPSIGCVCFPQDASEVPTLIQRGDSALAAAKDLGRNRIEFFKPSLEQGSHRRAHLKGLMRLGADRNEFRFMVQSKVNKHGSVIGAEILMRWTTDDFGSISPSEFIPMAEQSGMIHTLGKFALHEAAKLAAKLVKMGVDIPIAVNIAPLQFQSSDIEAIILRVCQDHKVDPSRIEIELTESALDGGLTRVVPILQNLRKKGFTLSLDDFGTGYSSLSHIQNLPFDKIKIDRIFVKDLPGDKKSLCVLECIVSLCNKLGLSIVAEGVETDIQFKTLVDLGILEFQGFKFSKPMNVPDWLKLISQSK